MPKNTWLLILLFFIINPFLLCGQEKDKDSIGLYHNIESFSKKRKITKNIHKWIFRPINSKNKTKASDIVTSVSYDRLQNKILRKIIFQSLDPFGETVHDTSRIVKNWYEKTGNKLHLRSKPWAIKNFLLIKKNEPIDTNKLKESERLIYSQRFIRNIKITPIYLDGNAKDSVDLIIRTQDAWTLIPKVSGSTSRIKTQIIQRNFAGLGHEVKGEYQRFFKHKENVYQFQYRIPNIKQTFIEARFNYLKHRNNNLLKEVEFSRDFFSNYARWAGGIKLEQFYRNDTIYNLQLSKEFLKYKYNKIDIWGGIAFTIFKDSPNLNRVTNFVTALRFEKTHYTQFPNPTYDPYNFYNHTNLWLGSFGITSREFNPTNNIFYQNIKEYIQTGRNIFITTGVENRNHTNRYYLGGRMSIGSYYKFGYLATFLDIGTFFNKGNTEQNLFRVSAFYMSETFNIGTWKFRQFAVPKLSIGSNRFPVWNDLTSLGENEGGFTSFTNQLRGSKKLQLTVQTQSYVPKSLWGFRLSPFLNANLGLLGNDTKSLFKSKLYTSFGVGVQLSNDYLVFDNLQFSFLFFPTTPIDGNNVLRTNSLNNNDINLPDFQIGKPEIAKYY